MSDFRSEVLALIPSLRRYARALTSGGEHADDLVQDCLVRAMTRADQWQTGTNLRAWLFTIMHNIFVDHTRRQARQPRLVPVEPEQAILASPPRQQASYELLQLQSALDRLPEEQRIVLLLVGLEGFNYQEAADVLEVPIGTVRSRLSRAREALRIEQEQLASEEAEQKAGPA